MQERPLIILGAVSLVGGALAFVLVFSYLASNFDYPGVLDGSAAEVLPRLLAGGTVMRSVWALYAFLPLLLVPGAVGTYVACPSSRGRMTLALVAASIGSFAMCLGLMRWPSIHWALAEAYASSGADAKHAISAVFLGLNTYLGNYIGEFLGEACLACFFLLSGLSLVGEPRFPKWIGWTGAGFSALLLIGALRNITQAVQPVADVNNILLPLWMSVLGIALIWYSPKSWTQGASTPGATG